MTRYVRVGGYPDTDPYRNEPEEEDRDPGWDDEDAIPENADDEGYIVTRTPRQEAARVERMRAEMRKALEADGEKLRALTGEDHGPYFEEEDWNGVL